MFQFYNSWFFTPNSIPKMNKTLFDSTCLIDSQYSMIIFLLRISNHTVWFFNHRSIPHTRCYVSDSHSSRSFSSTYQDNRKKRILSTLIHKSISNSRNYCFHIFVYTITVQNIRLSSIVDYYTQLLTKIVIFHLFRPKVIGSSPQLTKIDIWVPTDTL
jgi:hypothetical protein